MSKAGDPASHPGSSQTGLQLTEVDRLCGAGRDRTVQKEVSGLMSLEDREGFQQEGSHEEVPER